MGIGSILVLVLVLALVLGGLPHWGYWGAHHYGYYPSGIGLVLLVIVLLFLFGGFF